MQAVSPDDECPLWVYRTHLVQFFGSESQGDKHRNQLVAYNLVGLCVAIFKKGEFVITAVGINAPAVVLREQ